MIFFASGFFVVSTLVGAASIIGDNRALPGSGLCSWRSGITATGCSARWTSCRAWCCTPRLAVIALLPVSYLHGKILFNRAYAAVLGTEMRRRRVISLINAASASKSVREYYLRARSFVRGKC